MRKIYTICFALCFFAINVVCTKSFTDKREVGQINSTPASVASNKYITYIIPKSGQYSTPNSLQFTNQSKITFNAIFDSSCIYSTIDPKNQDDINKLYGFSDCNSNHLINSARVGWRWSKDSLRIFAFVHNDGAMLYKEITSVRIGSVIKCSISCLPGQYSFTVNNKTVQIPRHCSGDYTRYKLFPYFGGDEVAPHRIKIKIKELSN